MQTIRRALLLLTAAVLAVAPACLQSCNSGDSSLELVDPDAAPRDPDFQLVFNIIQNECAPCHDDDGDEDDEKDENEDRSAALLAGFGRAEPPLQTCNDIVEEIDDILDEIDDNTMPPGAWPRLSETEKLIIRRWYENGAKATCD